MTLTRAAEHLVPAAVIRFPLQECVCDAFSYSKLFRDRISLRGNM